MEALNKEIFFERLNQGVLFSTQKRLTLKEALIYPLPIFGLLALALYFLTKSFITALLLSLGLSLLFWLLFITFRLVTTNFYHTYLFNNTQQQVTQVRFAFGKAKSTQTWDWSENSLYLRQISRHHKKTAMFCHQEPNATETALLLVKGEKSVLKFLELTQLPFKEK